MLYAAEINLIFVHVSRTGGTTISLLLRDQIPDIKPFLNQHSSIIEAQSILGKSFVQCYKFAFVRNPWDRLVSWYALIGKTLHGSNISDDKLKDPASEHWKQFDSFLEEWSKLEFQIGGVCYKELSQWDQISDQGGRLLVDDIGKFESFDIDVHRIFNKAGLIYSPQAKLNQSLHHHYSVYYSDFGRDLVESVFQDDVKKLNYSFSFE